MLGRFLRARESYLVLAIVLITAITTVFKPHFLVASNIHSIAVSAAILGFIALGQTLVILGRGIDLSVSATLGLSALVVGKLANDHGMPPLPALAIGLALGLALGSINGVLIVSFRIPPIIATLATLSVYGALEFVYTDGTQVNSMPEAYERFGNAVRLGIPSIVWVFVTVVALVWYFSKYTRLGRDIYATGNNATHAALRGVRVGRAIFWTYAASGVLAGLAGFLYISYYATATATTGPGTNDQLTAIAISLIGGTALAGGRANFVCVAIASIFLSMTLTVAVFFGVPGIWDPAAEGLLILIVVLGDALLGRHAAAHSNTGLTKIAADPVGAPRPDRSDQRLANVAQSALSVRGATNAD